MVRVVITGMGTVNPLGLNVQESRKASLEGKSGIHRITAKPFFDPDGHAAQIAGFYPGFDGVAMLKTLMPTPEGKEDRDDNDNPDKRHVPKPHRFPRCTQLAMVAGYEAMAQSGLEVTEELADEFGVCIGTGGGGTDLYIQATRTLDSRGPSKVSSLYSYQLMPNHPAAMASILFGATGPIIHNSSACCTGHDAIRLGSQEILLGRCRAVLAGGTEAAINPCLIASYATARALTTASNDNPEAASRPFTLSRSGFVWAEGAWMFVLEEYEQALARGAHIIAEIIAAEATGDSWHETHPEPSGLGAQKAMVRALKKAGLNPEQVDHLSLHGTSTPLNDRIESYAIKHVFGSHALVVPAIATKSKRGHMIGASGTDSMAEGILDLREGICSQTLNYDDPDPECGLNLSKEVRDLRKGARIGMATNAGFGGHNTSILYAV